VIERRRQAGTGVRVLALRLGDALPVADVALAADDAMTLEAGPPIAQPHVRVTFGGLLAQRILAARNRTA